MQAIKDIDKANALNDYFSSVFTVEDTHQDDGSWISSNANLNLSSIPKPRYHTRWLEEGTSDSHL